ncbi:MAG: hypothetical protein JO111_00365 [Caulobacteraceae bacterium]|nr:hypothetical protein [Caulobacteraceae bacterium]
MTSYRIYVLDSDDHVASVVEREMDSDAAAMNAAEALRGDSSAAEVWRGVDLITRTGASFTPFHTSSQLNRPREPQV